MLGAIGVIISIIYLAAQIRNQNKESQRAAMNVLTTHWSDLNRSLVENPKLAALWIRALRSFDELDGASKLRFGAHLGRFLRFADSLYLGGLDGMLDDRLWRAYEPTLAGSVAYPGFQNWWATRKQWHTDEFCTLIERHIKTAKPKFMTATPERSRRRPLWQRHRSLGLGHLIPRWSSCSDSGACHTVHLGG